MNKNEIVIFETEDHQVKLPVNIENETVWLNRNQMAQLFDRDVKKKANVRLNDIFLSDNKNIYEFYYAFNEKVEIL